MSYRCTADCVEDLRRHSRLLVIRDEVDPYLEMAQIQRDVYAAKGPAILFEKVKGSPFPAVSNLFGSEEQTEFIFRRTFARTKRAIAIKASPEQALKEFWKYIDAPIAGWTSLPKKSWHAPVLECETTIQNLPQIVSWPNDGGAFVTLPQVYSEWPGSKSLFRSNIGMYRIQLSGNDYIPGKEIGLHYQIHRGLGIHHVEANRLGLPLKVSIFIGGPPAHTVAAVMPLPEDLSEVVFAGMLAGRGFRYANWEGWRIAADADFCIVGTIEGTQTKPEGPFGDHLGYYAKTHDFPVMKVEKVFHRRDAMWLFTVVGRPPQEDTSFGALIHSMTKPMVPVSIPGVTAMHAVDRAGVHPLLFAIGSERYTPYSSDPAPKELLTQASAILGFNQASLAKYLMIVDKNDLADLQIINDEQAFLTHVLERVDLERDLHFITKTSMDTLDYSGSGLNHGSKLIVAARGKPRRTLGNVWSEHRTLPAGYSAPHVVFPGVLAINGPRFIDYPSSIQDFRAFTSGEFTFGDEWPLVVVVDDSQFVAEDFGNFLWVVFTRSQPSHDVYGVSESIDFKHWGCQGSMMIDARIKPHHAPPLVEDPVVKARVVSWLKDIGFSSGPNRG